MSSDVEHVGLTNVNIQDNPFPYYKEQLSKCPVWHETDIDLYVIGGHEETRAALGDIATFSNKPSAGGRAANMDAIIAYQSVLKEKGWTHLPVLQRSDPPEHSRYRKLLNRVFTPAQVKAYVPQLEEIANSLIDSMVEKGKCEFVRDFALPLPGIFISTQLGLDPSQYPKFRRWAEAMLSLAQRSQITVEEAIIEANVEIEEQHFIAGEFEKRRANPGKDLISLLVNAHVNEEGEEPFTINELMTVLHALITGGFETTTGALSSAMLLLIEHPDQMEMLRNDRSLMGNFIEEVLRFDSPVQGLWRSVKCPVTLGGFDIPENKSAMVRFGAANRDPRVFDNPDVFDIKRANAKNHVAFGFGVHFCLGAALARQQMATAFNLLLDRLTEVELAGPMELPIHEPSFFLRPMRKLNLVVKGA
jgi:cytochrome P450